MSAGQQLNLNNSILTDKETSFITGAIYVSIRTLISNLVTRTDTIKDWNFVEFPILNLPPFYMIANTDLSPSPPALTVHVTKTAGNESVINMNHLLIHRVKDVYSVLTLSSVSLQVQTQEWFKSVKIPWALLLEKYCPL